MEEQLPVPIVDDEQNKCFVCSGRGWHWITSPLLLLALASLCVMGTILCGWALWSMWESANPARWFGGRHSIGSDVAFLTMLGPVGLWCCISKLEVVECWTCRGTGKLDLGG